MNQVSRMPRKSWNFSLAQSESLLQLFEQILSPLASEGFSAALITPECKTLHMKSGSAVDIATLPQAAHLCHQYLKLRDRDIVIVNDPYSGGTTLSEVTLVAGACFEAPSGEAELLLALRLYLPLRLPSDTKVDSEGVRIPPTPLASRGQINSDLLNAIAAHPLAPETFVDDIQRACRCIQKTLTGIQNLGKDPGSEFKKIHFKRYLSDSSLVFQSMMSRLTMGAKNVSTRLNPNGEILKLHLEVSEKHVLFDFAGTDPATHMGLTEMSTFGVCVAATIGSLDQDIPLNSGVLDHFQVSTPARTLLSIRPPLGTFRGIHLVSNEVGSLVAQAIASLKPQSPVQAGFCGAEASFQVGFASGKNLGLSAQPGTGATKESDGTDAHAVWGSQARDTLSIEEIERRFPLFFVFGGLRSGSGGKGARRGGNGVLYSFRLLEDATLRWMMGAMTNRQDGRDGGKAGLTALVEVTRAAGGETEELASFEGEVLLKAGDEVRIGTSGGGGLGAIAPEPTTT